MENYGVPGLFSPRYSAVERIQSGVTVLALERSAMRSCEATERCVKVEEYCQSACLRAREGGGRGRERRPSLIWTLHALPTVYSDEDLAIFQYIE